MSSRRARPPSPGSPRLRRVSETVKTVLAEALQDMKDPRIGFVTVTDVRLTADLRAADVFFTVLPDDPAARAETAEGLRSATPTLRREIGSRVRLRYVPDLRFVHDPLPEHGRRIERLLGAADDEGRIARPESTRDDGDR